MVARFWFALLCLVLISPQAFGGWWDYGESVADSYTLALYHYNDNAGTTAVDSSGHNYNLTLTNATIWDAATKKYGASSISPNNSYYGTQETLFDTVPASWSVGSWVAPKTLHNNTVLDHEAWFSRCGGPGCDATKIVCYWPSNSGYLRCYIETGGSTYAVVSTRVSWPQDEWHYIQVIFDGINLNLRVDGVLQDQTASVNLPNGNYSFNFGVAQDFVSNISNFRIDETEIASIDRNLNAPGAPITTGDLNISTIEGYDVNSTPFFSYDADGNLTIDFNVSNSDNNRLRLDFNYSSSSVQGTGTRIFEDLNLTSSICPSQNWDTNVSQCHIDWNIHSSLVSDGNYYLLFDLNRSAIGNDNFFKASGKRVGIINNPNLTIHLFDENKLTKILTANAVINGTTYYPGVDGNITITMGVLSGEKIISVGQDGNYEFRNFYFNFSEISGNKDFNAFLLKDTNGELINFEFYSENGLVKLTSEIVTVIKDMAAVPIVDNNIAGQAKLSGGKATFFLNPDANYIFKIVGTSTNYYYPVNVTVAIPKNEVSLATISPFDLVVSGIGIKQFLNYFVVVHNWIFPNTTSSYIFDVNAGLDYYSRQYFLSILGNPHTYTLQPYLVVRADALNTIFYVRNNVSSAGIQGIRIISKKNIPGQGIVIVEEVVTDSAGEATISFIQNDTYYLYFYEGEIQRYYIELRPNFISYQVYLDLGQIVINEPINLVIDVNFMPRSGIAFLIDGNLDFNQRITVFNGTLAYTRVVVINAGRILYDINFDANSNSQFFQQRFVDANINQLSPVRIDVTVSASGYTKTFSHSYLVQGSTSVGSQLMFSLTRFFPVELGGGGLLILSVLVVIIVTGFAGSQIGTDSGALGLIAVITSGLLCFLGWIPIIVFGGIAASWLAIYMLTRRLEY